MFRYYISMVFILSYNHTKSSGCVAGIYVFVGTEFCYYVTSSFFMLISGFKDSTG